MSTDRACLAPCTTCMTGVEVTTRIEYRLFHSIVANQTFLLLGILIHLNLRWGLFRNGRGIDDFNIFDVLDTVIILVPGRHQFDYMRFYTKVST